MNTPGEFDFSFEIGLRPDFEIPALKNKTHLNRYKINVTDKMLEDELDRIKRRFGKVESQDAVTNKEDIIYATYETSDASGNIAADAAKIEDTEVLDKMPAKLRDMLMGKKAGEHVVFRPKDVCTAEELDAFLKDPLKASAEAAEQNYKLTLTKVGLLIPKELGQELYQQVFQNKEIKDEADFREKLREELSVEFVRLGRERLHNEIFELLVHNTPIDLPVDFLKRWMREGGEKPKSADEVEREFSGFEHQLRWQLISDKIMAENNIVVTREDVNRDIKTRVLAYFGLTADEEDQAPWMEGYMSKIAKDDKTMDETYRRLVMDKLFQHLEGQFAIDDKEIGEEEFFKLEDAHAAHHHRH
jgi:trigger factor